MRALMTPSEYGLLHTTPVITIVIEKPAIRFSKSNFGSPDHVTNIKDSNTSYDNESRYESDKDFRNSNNHNRYQNQYGTWNIVSEVPHAVYPPFIKVVFDSLPLKNFNHRFLKVKLQQDLGIALNQSRAFKVGDGKLGLDCDALPKDTRLRARIMQIAFGNLKK
ncbi:MAG: hypothetical protein SV375_07730 [Thermodesulfobacteriota bacterium]|nr:hypothetical protein [Thermodesulfobacteriota bacterium]